MSRTTTIAEKIAMCANNRNVCCKFEEKFINSINYRKMQFDPKRNIVDHII